jgi:hypothetical protein
MLRDAVAGAVRAAMGALLTIVIITLGASCVSVLDLSDYAGAAETFCDHLVRCFGEGAYAGCFEHVTAGLDEGSPEDRAAWLAALTSDDCLAKCSSGVACLDADPVCNDTADSCGQLEHCCGFQAGSQACEGGNCCLPDGQLCGEGATCCSECNPATGTCGGVAPCVLENEVCQVDEDCCSDNCLPDGVCGLLCRERGTDCVEDSDCCTELCDGAICACRPDGANCARTAQCCETGSVCLNGTCDPSPECIPAGDLGCTSDGGCCQGAGLPSTTCTPKPPDGNVCCAPNAEPVGSGQAALCCSLNESDGSCCADLSEPCEPGDGDCCSAQICLNQGAIDSSCCNPAQCGNPCGPHPFPLSSDGTCGGTSVSFSCLDNLCKDHPECCCEAWSTTCVALVKTTEECLVDCQAQSG